MKTVIQAGLGVILERMDRSGQQNQPPEDEKWGRKGESQTSSRVKARTSDRSKAGMFECAWHTAATRWHKRRWEKLGGGIRTSFTLSWEDVCRFCFFGFFFLVFIILLHQVLVAPPHVGSLFAH